MSSDIYKHAQSLKKYSPSEIAIEVSHLTKDYGKGRGIFDVSFCVPRGKTFGYCGTNGAGKTTTLRHLMGFLKPDSGFATINGLNCWENAETIKKVIGYLPGEIAFPAVENGSEFLKIQADMINLTDMSKAERIINSLQLDPTANLKRMSKGMKQKTALVAAFMHSPDIILLDEPTTGLDPLMREVFVNLIKEEQKRGATIIMSNHMFDELEETCDYVAFIKDGHLIDIVDMNEIHERNEREYFIALEDSSETQKIDLSKFEIVKNNTKDNSIVIKVKNENVNDLFKELSKVKVKLIKENQYTLEDFFMDNVIKEDIKDAKQ